MCHENTTHKTKATLIFKDTCIPTETYGRWIRRMHIILIKTGTFGNSEMESEEEEEGENNSINNTTHGPCTDASSPRTEK